MGNLELGRSDTDVKVEFENNERPSVYIHGETFRQKKRLSHLINSCPKLQLSFTYSNFAMSV